MFVVIAAFVSASSADLSQRHSAQTAIQPTWKPSATLRYAEPSSIYDKHLKIDLYEGQIYEFQPQRLDSPEIKAALNKE